LATVSLRDGTTQESLGSAHCVGEKKNLSYYARLDPEVKHITVTAWLPTPLARALLAVPCGARVTVSLDLGRSTTTVLRSPGGIDTGSLILSEETLKSIARFRDLIVEATPSGAVLPLRVVHEGKLHQLVPTKTAPTVMIAGIQMHRRDDAWEDAKTKARRVVRKGAWVLDTCGGLGYTASCALDAGAGLVVSTEPNPAILALRRHNPWSPPDGTTGLCLHGIPVERLVESLPGGTFDAVLHDPPRFSLAGWLYGRSFYATLRRVMRTGGRLYHYTGEPYRKKRGNAFVHNTAGRLSEAGFSVVWDEQTAGLVGVAR
jgi:hypothetical protein